MITLLKLYHRTLQKPANSQLLIKIFTFVKKNLHLHCRQNWNRGKMNSYLEAVWQVLQHKWIRYQL